jgi:ubiquinone biosynthesis protein COQ9
MADRTSQRDELLERFLEHAAFEGWSRQALRAAAEDLALSPAEAELLYPGGPAELYEDFVVKIHRLMNEGLAPRDISSLRVHEKVALAVSLRLEAMLPHREAVRRGLSFLALPRNAGLGLKILYSSVDEIWRAVGDRSTDYNFYSKRLLLAGVYSTTLLFWLDDRSEDQKDTKAFLERRINEVLKVGGQFGKTMSRILNAPDSFFARRGAPIRPRRF